MRIPTMLIGILTPLLLAGCVLRGEETGKTRKMQPSVETGIRLAETAFDFGIIKQSGGKVSHNFAFTYTGEETIAITALPTSCVCASAETDRREFEPGESGILTVTFNPNLHAEPEGRFYKSVTILTNPPLAVQPEVKIWAEIDLDLGPEAFELEDDHGHTGNEQEDHSH